MKGKVGDQLTMKPVNDGALNGQANWRKVTQSNCRGCGAVGRGHHMDVLCRGNDAKLCIIVFYHILYS